MFYPTKQLSLFPRTRTLRRALSREQSALFPVLSVVAQEEYFQDVAATC